MESQSGTIVELFDTHSHIIKKVGVIHTGPYAINGWLFVRQYEWVHQYRIHIELGRSPDTTRTVARAV